MKTLAILPVCAALGLNAFLPAQEPDPFRFVPADAAAVIQIDGPMKLRERFARTNAFLMLMSPEAEEAWEMFDEGVAQMVDEAREQGVELQPFVDALEGYAGRLTVSVAFDIESMEEADWGASQPPLDHLLVTVALTPDGETDLNEIAERIAETVEDSGQVLMDLDIGDGVRAMEGPGEDVVATVPTVLDGHLVMAFGGGVERRMQALLAGEGGMQPALGEADAASGVWMHVTPRLRDFAMQLAGHSMASMTGLDMQDAAAQIQSLLRMDGFEGFTFRMRPSGPRVLEDWEFRSDPALPSVVDFMRPDRQSTAMLDLMPRTGQTFTATSVDLGLIFDTVFDFAELMGEGGREEMVDEFRDETGVDLFADLVDRFTGDLGYIDASTELLNDMDEPGMAVGLPLAMAFVLGVDDHAAVAETLDGLLRKSGLHAARTKAEYRETELYTIPFMGFLQFHYAFSDGVAMLGVGEKGSELLRGAIDRAVLKAEGQELPEWPEAVTSRLEEIESGWRDLAVSRNVLDPEVIVSAVEDALQSQRSGAVPDGLDERTRRVIETLVRLQREFDLETQLSAGRFQKGRMLLQRSW